MTPNLRFDGICGAPYTTAGFPFLELGTSDAPTPKGREHERGGAPLPPQRPLPPTGPVEALEARKAEQKVSSPRDMAERLPHSPCPQAFQHLREMGRVASSASCSPGRGVRRGDGGRQNQTQVVQGDGADRQASKPGLQKLTLWVVGRRC